MVEVQLGIDSGAWGRDEALRLLRSKYAVWLDQVGTPTLYALCRKKEVFTTDDLFDELEGRLGRHALPVERRVLGALVRGFALKGLIVKTGVTEKSVRPSCHARDKAIWRSLIYVPVVNPFPALKNPVYKEVLEVPKDF
jgi:hypothetical protein